mmetsp:Transcript_12411/g.33756  ORF Transcript_12411/g.33756 Transcript_12411/m.33756 type:complete len:82 (+) Transcript_12411:630-875(+)
MPPMTTTRTTSRSTELADGTGRGHTVTSVSGTISMRIGNLEQTIQYAQDDAVTCSTSYPDQSVPRAQCNNPSMARLPLPSS